MPGAFGLHQYAQEPDIGHPFAQCHASAFDLVHQEEIGATLFGQGNGFGLSWIDFHAEPAHLGGVQHPCGKEEGWQIGMRLEQFCLDGRWNKNLTVKLL